MADEANNSAGLKRIIATAKADVTETVALFFAPVVAVANTVAKVIHNDSSDKEKASRRNPPA
jgi:hypothetical protein